MDYRFWNCWLYSTSNCSGLSEMVLTHFAAKNKAHKSNEYSATWILQSTKQVYGQYRLTESLCLDYVDHLKFNR